MATQTRVNPTAGFKTGGAYRVTSASTEAARRINLKSKARTALTSGKPRASGPLSRTRLWQRN